jgi:YegS/Rv2252/BmrU family lipid kinase|tara:strand:- start:6892 stop:7797 length:906 start_codon:yes stop_codon:yes gene_type:complete
MKLKEIKKLCFLVNPKAGKQKSETIIRHIKHELEKKSIEFNFFHSDKGGSISEFIQKEDLKGFDGLCVLGGDGTINEAINGLMMSHQPQNIPLGIIPIGSGNAFAETLGELDPIKMLSNILTGETSLIDVFKIDDREKTFFAINIIGWGMAAEVNILAEKLRWMGGIRYSVASLITVMRMKEKYLKANLDDSSIEDQALFFLALNNVHTGKGMQMAPNAILDDGLIDIILVRSASKPRVLKIFTQLFSGTHIEDPHVEYSQITSFDIETLNDPLNIDGENKGRTPIKVELINKGVRIFGKI